MDRVWRALMSVIGVVSNTHGIKLYIRDLTLVWKKGVFPYEMKYVYVRYKRIKISKWFY
jgi:hypothetical protein